VRREQDRETIGFRKDALYRFDQALLKKLRLTFEKKDRATLLGLWDDAKALRMKPRHAAALVLVGWYLVIIPNEARLKQIHYPPQYRSGTLIATNRVASVSSPS
jgi:hypothetical protein